MSNVEIYDLSRDADVSAFEALRASGALEREIDAVPEAVEELFRIEFPFIPPGSPAYARTFARYRKSRWSGGDLSRAGVWVHYPWRHCAVHLPSEPDFHRLRTARNRFLITDDEQHTWHTSLIGVAGLSVGLSVVTTIALTGGAGALRIGDHDVLGITNLNRLLGSVTQLGDKKTEICSQRVLELDPFARIQAFDGVDDASLDAFLGSGNDALDLLIEEMDDIRMKAVVRFAARERRMPVVMATDNGDNAIIDVERFDTEPDRPLFHGSVPEAKLRSIPAVPSLSERVSLASAIVGADITPRTQLSLQEVGARLPAWPQLGTAATLSGVGAAYAARRILTGQTMPSGRYRVGVDAALDVEFSSPASVAERAAITADFLNNLNAMFGVHP